MSSARKERAAIMEQKKKEEERKAKAGPSREARSLKTASSVSSAGSSGSKSRDPILYSATGMAGTGLWCQPTDSSLPPIPERDPTPPKPVTTELTIDVEQRVNKEIIATLERKASKFAAELDKESISKKELEFKVQHLQRMVENYKNLAEEAQGQIQDAAGKNSQLEQEMDQHTLYRNYATTQIDHLNKELDNERARAEMYYQMYEELTKRHEDEIGEYTEEVESLKQRLSSAQEDSSKFSAQLYECQIALEKYEAERHALGAKLTEEVVSAQTSEERAKTKSSKMNILIGENHALSQRIKELEEGKRKSGESIKRRDEEIKEAKAAIEVITGRLKAEMDLRKHQSDLAAQREYRLNLVHDRYEKVQMQIEDLLRENERLKDAVERKTVKSPIRVVKDKETVLPVRVNPNLAM